MNDRQRVIRIGIQVDGRINWYDGLRIRANGTKFDSSIQAEATIIISGLTIETRNQILTDTSPYNYYRTPRRVYLDVGREGGAVFRIFEGDVVSSEPGQAPDLDVTLRAQTVYAFAQQVISTSYGLTIPLSQIAKDVAASMSLGLRFEATDKKISRFIYLGSKRDQVRALEQAGDVIASVDGSELIVRDSNKPRRGNVRILNEDSGMVGLPCPTSIGCNVSFTIEGEALIGGVVSIDSKYYKVASGDYIISQLKFDVDTHGDAFFYTAICRNMD